MKDRYKKGKLILATFDLQNDLDKRPVARQMLSSILNYMNSSSFSPDPLSGFETLKNVFEARRQSETVCKEYLLTNCLIRVIKESTGKERHKKIKKKFHERLVFSRKVLLLHP